jgi:hypothetical protein
MPAGQLLNVVICAAADPGTGNGQVFGPVSDSACPSGQNAYVVSAYVSFSTSRLYSMG